MSIFLSTLFFAVAAQSNDDCADFANFEQCRRTVADYQLLTCAPLQVRNATWFSICSCYQAINDRNCFDRCPGSEQGQQLLTSTVIPNRDALCNPLNINPLAPPPTRQPWDSFVQTTSTSQSLPPTSTATASASTQTPKNDAFSLQANSIFSGFFAFLLAVL